MTTTLISAVVFGLLFFARSRGVSVLQPIRRRRGQRGKPVARRAAAKSSTVKAKAPAKYHAVKIEMDPNPCAAVREYDGKPLLSNEAPSLPLSDCDQAACTCRFEHQDDRRMQTRRGYQSDLGLVAAAGSNSERRERSGRRDDDQMHFD